MKQLSIFCFIYNIEIDFICQFIAMGHHQIHLHHVGNDEVMACNSNLRSLKNIEVPLIYVSAEPNSHTLGPSGDIFILVVYLYYDINFFMCISLRRRWTLLRQDVTRSPCSLSEICMSPRRVPT